MKLLSIFPLLFISLTSKAVPSSYLKGIDSVTILPLHFYGTDTKIIVNSRVGSGSLKIYISNDTYQDQLIVSEKIYKSGSTVITYDNFYTRESNQIYVSLNNSIILETSDPVTMNAVHDSYRYIVDNQSLVSTGIVYTIGSTLKWKGHKVTHSFKNFDGLYIPDYYHKIRLDDFAINLAINDLELFDCTPFLIITNVNGVFNDIATTSSVEFPLNLVATKTGYTFELKDTLYVHKETLMLSKIAKPGYVATRHIFFPRNEMKNVDKYRCVFALQNFGVDKGFVRHNFEIRAIKNIIGDCQNSEYCIQRL